jgi:pimeloyl-ACP methyl ester carboxylesterase
MIATAVLALASLAPTASTATAPQGGTATQATAPAHPNLSPRQLRALQQRLNLGGGANSPTLGGGFTTGVGPQVQVSGSPVPGVWQIVLGDPGTGWEESVLLGVPTTPLVPNTPLLVMFHGNDISEWDCYVNTPLFQDALDRGWYVLAPLGAHQVNWGIPYAQQNIEYALTLFTDLLPIDPTRIYGIGFSMGGGTMMSYAARHQDLNRPRFAALVNHTGSTSVAHVYGSVANTFVLDHPLMFNGPPSNDPFLYSQASVFDLETGSLAVDPATDLARNLGHVPVLNQHADFDPLGYLVEQTQSIHAWLSAIPGMETFLLTPPHSVHSWTTIDEPTALNYLQSKALQTPAEGQHRLLADREGGWFHFYVYQDAPGAFTPLRWTMNSVTNTLVLDETENLARVVVDTLSIGLNTEVNVDLVMQSADGGTEVTTLTGYELQPQEVLRDGVPTTSWSWDPVGETVTLTETDPGAGVTWRVRP